MSFEFIEGVGMVHFNMAKPPRVVPGHERHKWSRKPLRGQTAVCLKCGTAKCYRLSYEVVYRRAGETQILTERPACTGIPEATPVQDCLITTRPCTQACGNCQKGGGGEQAKL